MKTKKITTNREVARLLTAVKEYWLNYYTTVSPYSNPELCSQFATTDIWNQIKAQAVERQIEYLQMELEDYAKAAAKRAASAVA